MMMGVTAVNGTTPDCAALTKPTATVLTGEGGQLRWTPALALSGGGAIAKYEILADGVVPGGRAQNLSELDFDVLVEATHPGRLAAVPSVTGHGGGASAALSPRRYLMIT